MYMARVGLNLGMGQYAPVLYTSKRLRYEFCCYRLIQTFPLFYRQQMALLTMSPQHEIRQEIGIDAACVTLPLHSSYVSVS